jgi:hypothetical protein
MVEILGTIFSCKHDAMRVPCMRAACPHEILRAHADGTPAGPVRWNQRGNMRSKYVRMVMGVEDGAEPGNRPVASDFDSLGLHSPPPCLCEG